MRAPPAEAQAWPQFAMRIAEERPDDWFVLLDVASTESGIIITNLLFSQGPLTCDASFFSLPSSVTPTCTVSLVPNAALDGRSRSRLHFNFFLPLNIGLCFSTGSQLELLACFFCSCATSFVELSLPAHLRAVFSARLRLTPLRYSYVLLAVSMLLLLAWKLFLCFYRTLPSPLPANAL